jgi:hypothetical protein
MNRRIESRYPTQAKVRLEWGTQRLLLSAASAEPRR